MMNKDNEHLLKQEQTQQALTQGSSRMNVSPVKIVLKGDPGKRVVQASARRIMKTHAKEIAALALK